MDIIFYKVEQVQDLIEEATKVWEPWKAASYVHMIGYKMEEVYQLIIGQEKEVPMETSQEKKNQRIDKLLKEIEMISPLYASLLNEGLEIDKIRRIHGHVKDMVSTLVVKIIDDMLEEEHEQEVEEQRRGERSDEPDENEPSTTESVLYRCAEENTDNFMSEWQKANQEVSHLLNRNTEIVARATKLPQCDIPSINFQPDIDGIVVELTSFAGITFPLTHISILRNDYNSLERIYPKLKKHLDLRNYSEQTLSVLAQCKGTEISIEGPWHIWLGVVLLAGTVFQQIRFLNMTKVTYDYIKSVGTTLKCKAAGRALAGSARNTLMKVDLSSVKHWTVMPDECMDVLKLLQVAVDEVTLPDGLIPIIFAFRFGERTKHDISLTGFNMIRKTTVHVGVTISSNDLQLLWARHGLQQVTGDRGTLYSCCSFSDIVNFQSNTDGRNIDVSADVLNVCTIPNQVQFVQFYGDIPHRRPHLTVYHPVSGIILCGDVINKATCEAIERAYGPYIFSFDQNVNLLRDLRCRMEFVVEVPPVPHVITPHMYVSLPNIERLLLKYDLLVPYVNSDDSLLSALRSVGTQMTERLCNLYDEYRLTGDSTATWEAYYLELCLEKMFWGRPASPVSNKLAVEIGPGAVSLMNCRTGQLGFLALEPWIYRARPPPLKIWFKSSTAMSKVETFYGFHNFLDSTCELLGKQFIKRFLEDSFISQSVLPGSCVDFFQHLQGQPNSHYKGVSIGKMSREDVAMSLMTMASPRASKVCTRMIEFLTLADLQLQDVLLPGIIENQLVRFPVIQTWDTSGNKTFRLIPNKFIELCSADGSDKEEAERLTTAIIQQLETRQLVYARKFNYLKGASFPWIIPVRDKLNKRKKRLNATQLLDTLTFVSCVALIQQKWFVNFKNIDPMLSTLPVNQFTMQSLQILGNIDLSFVGTLKIRRLHKSIPFQLPTANATVTTAEKSDVENPKPTEESEAVNHTQDVVEEYEEDTKCQDMVKSPTTHLPMTVKTFWTAPELEILHVFKMKKYRQNTLKELFEIYCNLCRDRKVPDRSFDSFKSKLNRVMST